MITDTSPPPSPSAGQVEGGGGPQFWVAAATALSAITALAVAITTPPRTGPYCRSACLAHPYTGSAEFVPRDFWWMYLGSLVVLLAMVMIAGLPHGHGPGTVLAWRTSTILAAIATGVLVTDYALQLTVVQPSLRRGETDGLALLSQYNPHGVFIGLENVGYALFGLAFLGAGAAMRVRSRLLCAVRTVLVIGGSAIVVALVGYAAAYRIDLEYRFEVAGIGLCWLVLIAAGVLLALDARRAP